MTTKHHVRQLALLYLGRENGLSIQALPRLFADPASHETRVVSARTCPMSSDACCFGDVEVDMLDGLNGQHLQSAVVPRKVLFDHAFSIPPAQLTHFEQQSTKNRSAIRSIQSDWRDVSAQKAMVLVDCSALEPGALQSKLGGLHLDFLQIKMGGPELMVEFLLSSFCVNPLNTVIEKPGFEGLSSLEALIAQSDAFEWVLNWDVSIEGTIQAPEYLTDTFEGGIYKDSCIFYEYALDRKTLKKLEDLLRIPFRIDQILSDEQKLQLKTGAFDVLLDELDLMNRELFRLPVIK